MRGNLKRTALIVVAVLAAAAGAVLAIVTSEGRSGSPKVAHSTAPHSAAPGDMAVAAGYLGMSTKQLRQRLSRGSTLAQIASATPGRSVAGLVQRLSSAKLNRLQAAVAAGRVTAASETARAARVDQQASAEVNRVLSGAGGAAGELDAAAHYLGIPLRQLRRERRTGRSLAQIASAAGKSPSALIAALVGSGRSALEAARSSGAMSAAQEQKLLATLTRRVSAEVQRAPATRGSVKASTARPQGAGRGPKASSTPNEGAQAGGEYESEPTAG